MIGRDFGLGALCTLLVVVGACATTYPYPFYAPQMPGGCYDQGQLLGKSGSDGWPDMKLSECKPDAEPSPGDPSPGPSPILMKCAVMKIDDKYAEKAALEKCQADLVACEHGSPPNP